MVIDDDPSMLWFVSEIFTEKYNVLSFNNAQKALDSLEQRQPDLIISDVMMPDIDWVILHPPPSSNNKLWSHIPLILLLSTASRRRPSKRTGIGGGVPMSPSLSISWKSKPASRRSSAVLGSKQEKQEKAKTVEVGELKLDCEGRRVFISGKEINLTAKEFDVLELLVFNPNKVYSRENLLNIVWGYEYPGDVRTVDVHIRRLREKIEANPSEPKYVHTKWGVGYYFQA